MLFQFDHILQIEELEYIQFLILKVSVYFIPIFTIINCVGYDFQWQLLLCRFRFLAS